MTRTKDDDLRGQRDARPAGPAVSVATQTVEQLGGGSSLLVLQRRDHAVLEDLLHALDQAQGAEQDEVLTRLGRLVFPHAYAEETVVWPVLRAVLPDGEALTERNEQEHQDINELWSELETTADAPRRRELLQRISTLLRQDARDEEDMLLPRLQGALTDQQLRRLGRTWALVRRTAPTRPHARVSRRPPGNLLSGAPLSLLDRSRDALDRAARGRPTLAPACSASSRALALVAGAIDHLPPLQHGERASTRPHRTDAHF